MRADARAPRAPAGLRPGHGQVLRGKKKESVRSQGGNVKHGMRIESKDENWTVMMHRAPALLLSRAHETRALPILENECLEVHRAADSSPRSEALKAPRIVIRPRVRTRTCPTLLLPSALNCRPTHSLALYDHPPTAKIHHPRNPPKHRSTAATATHGTQYPPPGARKPTSRPRSRMKMKSGNA